MSDVAVTLRPMSEDGFASGREASVLAYAADKGALEAHDAARGTNVVETLETFLATRNAALAARQLYVHDNTLKNRLARIEEVIGPYLEDADRCLSLSVALRLRRLPSG